ncbi:MAG: MFS transporter [Phycisphaerales bacterium]
MQDSHRITATQWRALTAAWLGWCFDGLDGYLYIMVAGRFVRQLLEREALAHLPAGAAAPIIPDGEVNARAALIQGVFLVGWAVGGAVFGRVGDRLGRTRTLVLTVLTYAVFTGLSFFATTWWMLMAFRFVAALGIGGEWAAGSALVSETLHARHRAWASATLQSGYMVGCILASLTSGLLAGHDPKWVFVIGVAPALLTLWIRSAVPEPEEWAREARSRTAPAVSALFAPRLFRTTVATSALTSIALTTVWSFLYFAPQAVKSMADVAAWAPADKQALAARVAVFYFTVNIAANYAATYLAEKIGYRWSFGIFFAGATAAMLLGYRVPMTLGNVYVTTGAVAFFGLGLFGMFPLYIPPLFPTLVRTLGAGFTYNVGRVFSALGAFAGGWIAGHAGGPVSAMWYTAFLYIPGLLLVPFIAVPARHQAAGRGGEGAGPNPVV